MTRVHKSTIAKALADLTINLASGWFGILLISPGFLGASFSKYLELLILNMPPGILALLLGIFLLERAKTNEF